MQRNTRYPAGGVLLLCSIGAAAQPAGIEPAPAFSADQLLAPPTDSWITNGGNVANQRYSPLTGINRDNVGELRASGARAWAAAPGPATAAASAR